MKPVHAPTIRPAAIAILTARREGFALLMSPDGGTIFGILFARSYRLGGRDLVQRLSHGQRTRKRQAIVALARRLLVRCWAMMRDGTSWNADHKPTLIPTTV